MKIKLFTITRFLIYSVTFLFAYYAGTSTVGPDFHAYMDMIYRTTLATNIYESLIFAKDPFFGFIVYLVHPTVRDEYIQVMLSISMLVLINRFIIIEYLKFKFIPYFLIYVLFFSPAYDFSAIRALLGLSYFLIYIIYSKSRFKYIFAFLSLSSHVSMVLPLFLSSGIFSKFIRRYGALSICSLVFFLGFISVKFIYLIPQTYEYRNMPGSWTLFFRSFISLVIVYYYYRFYYQKSEISQRIILQTSLLISSFAFGSIGNAIVTTRLMDISNYIILVFIFSLTRKQIGTINNFFILIFSVILIILNSLFRMISSDLLYVLIAR